MPSPRGFDDPALASIPPAGNSYFAQDVAVGGLLYGPDYYAGENPAHPGQARDNPAPSFGRELQPLMFAGSTNAAGEKIVGPASPSGVPQSGRGHVSEVLNFHGSPAPWILIGILLVAGLLHLSAGARFGAGKL